MNLRLVDNNVLCYHLTMSKYPKVVINNGKITCYHCKEEKELSFFSKQNHTSIGYRGICKSCCSKNHKEKKYATKYYYSVKDSPDFKKNMTFKNKKAWEKMKNDPEKMERERLRRTSWYHKSKNELSLKPERRYRIYVSAAKQKNRDFLISYEDFIKHFWQKDCYYCGDLVKNAGIDRLDNNIGYVLDNCVSCCSMCNWMKRSFPEKEFIEKCIKISNKHNI